MLAAAAAVDVVTVAVATKSATSKGVEPALIRLTVTLTGGVARFRGGGGGFSVISDETISVRVVVSGQLPSAQFAVVLAGGVRTGALEVAWVAARDTIGLRGREGGSVTMPRGPTLLLSLWRGGRVGDFDVIDRRCTARSSEFARGETDCWGKVSAGIRLERTVPLGPRLGGGSEILIL